MSDTYLEEVKSALNKDETRLGDVWRRPEKKPKQIAGELGVPSSSWVYNSRKNIRAIVDGSVPTGIEAAKECGRCLRGFADRHRDSLSSETISKLKEKADECDRSAADSTIKADRIPPSESDDWSEVLLDKLRDMSPNGFEKLCQELLYRSGFIEVKVTGKSGDEGIDGHGIIRLVGLISFQVLFQCKRYRGKVGASVVRDFRGALEGRAEKGLILTTGGFTEAAQREATRDGAKPIDLIDGKMLAMRMKDLGLGVNTSIERTETEVIQVNTGWFKSFE